MICCTSSLASCIDEPCPDYELTSLRGKIKRVEARIAELDNLQAAAKMNEYYEK